MDRKRTQIEVEREADEFIKWIDEQEKIHSNFISISTPVVEPKKDPPKKLHHAEAPTKTDSTKSSGRKRSISEAGQTKSDSKSKSKDSDDAAKHVTSPRITTHKTSKSETSSLSVKRKARSSSSSGVVIAEKEPEKLEIDHSFVTFNSGQKVSSPSGLKPVAISDRPVHVKHAQKLDTETMNLKPNQYNTVAMIKKNQRQGIMQQNAEGMKRNDNMNEVIANVQGAKQIQALKADLAGCDDEERRRKETVLRIMAAKRNNK